MVPVTQPDISTTSDNPDIRLVLANLEAEYRIYRKAAVRYHANAEKGFEAALFTLKTAQTHQNENSAGSNALLPGISGSITALEPLTNREIQLLKLIAEGNSTKQAAAVLGIAFKTAVGHRTALMQKLNIHDTATLVRYAIRAGLIEP